MLAENDKHFHLNSALTKVFYTELCIIYLMSIINFGKLGTYGGTVSNTTSTLYRRYHVLKLENINSLMEMQVGLLILIFQFPPFCG